MLGCTADVVRLVIRACPCCLPLEATEPTSTSSIVYVVAAVVGTVVDEAVVGAAAAVVDVVTTTTLVVFTDVVVEFLMEEVLVGFGHVPALR